MKDNPHEKMTTRKIKMRPTQWDRVELLAAADNRSVGNFIRTALNRYSKTIQKRDENGDVLIFPLDED